MIWPRFREIHLINFKTFKKKNDLRNSVGQYVAIYFECLEISQAIFFSFFFLSLFSLRKCCMRFQ